MIKISEYTPITSTSTGDLYDVSVLVSSMPDVYATKSIEFSKLKENILKSPDTLQRITIENAAINILWDDSETGELNVDNTAFAINHTAKIVFDAPQIEVTQGLIQGGGSAYSSLTLLDAYNQLNFFDGANGGNLVITPTILQASHNIAIQLNSEIIKIVSSETLDIDTGFAIRNSTDTADYLTVSGSGKVRVSQDFFGFGTNFLETIQNPFFPSAAQIQIISGIEYRSRGEIGLSYNSHNFTTKDQITTAGSKLITVSNYTKLFFDIDKDGVIGVYNTTNTNAVSIKAGVTSASYTRTLATAQSPGGLLYINSSGVESYDTNTYLTTGSAGSTYLPLAGGNMTGSILFASSYGIDSVATGGSDVLNIGATNANVINYGNSSTIHNFLGTAIYELQVNSYVTDKLMTLNYGGTAGSGIGVGFEIEENAIITGYQKTNAARTGWSFKAPANTDYTDLVFSASTPRTITFPNATGTVALTSDLAAYQPLDSDLTSWAGVTRASGFDTFVATPSSANLAALITDEVGSGKVVFESALQNSADKYAVATGTDTYAATLSPVPTAYVTGQVFKLSIPNTNTITNPTLNINSLGAKTIVGANGAAIYVGHFIVNGTYDFLYDGTNFVLQAGQMDRKSTGYYRKTGTGTFEFWYSQGNNNGATTTTAFAKDRVYYFPFNVEKAVTLDRIGLEVTGAGTASSLIRIGIYNSANVLPTTLVLDAGTILGDSGTQQAITINQALVPGLYLLCLTHNSTANITIRALIGSDSPNFLGFPNNSLTPNNFYHVANTYAVLASTAVAPDTLTNNVTGQAKFRLRYSA